MLEKAAGTLGAPPWKVVWDVTLPLSRRGILAGVVLAFARSLGEFGATLMVAGNIPGRTQTMPLAVYMGFEVDLTRALTIAVLLLAVSFAILVSVRAFLRGYGGESEA